MNTNLFIYWILTYSVMLGSSYKFDNHGNRKVIVSPKPVSWQEAAKFCSERGLRLPGDRNDEERKMMVAAMNRSNLRRIWLDMRRNELPKWTWLDGHEIAEAPTRGQGPRCAYIRSTAPYGIKCLTKLPGFMCEINCSSCTEARCHQVENRCFYLQCKESKNWYQAARACWEEGGRLASRVGMETIRSPGQCSDYWVGLVKDLWKHSTSGDIVSYGRAPWVINDRRTRLNCTTFQWRDSKASWVIERCDAKHRVVCLGNENGGKTQSVAPLPPTPTPGGEPGENMEPDRETPRADAAWWKTVIFIVCAMTLALVCAVVIVVVIKKRCFKRRLVVNSNSTPNHVNRTLSRRKEYNESPLSWQYTEAPRNRLVPPQPGAEICQQAAELLTRQMSDRGVFFYQGSDPEDILLQRCASCGQMVPSGRHSGMPTPAPPNLSPQQVSAVSLTCPTEFQDPLADQANRYHNQDRNNSDVELIGQRSPALCSMV